MSARVALATATDAWDRDEDAQPLVDALGAAGLTAAPAVWTDPSVDWSSFDLVLVRSTWDYTSRLAEFLAWAERVESVTGLANPAAVLAWNTDKHYLAELTAAGLPVAPTTFLDHDDPQAPDRAEDLFALLGLADDTDLVVKPTVSAGSKDTARHPAGEAAAAAEHARELLAAGRDVMVQPYLSAVDTAGETGMVFFGGRFSHGFRKAPLLLEGRAQVQGLFAEERIEARTPTPAELELAQRVVSEAERRTGGAPLLYARVDVLPDDDGTPTLLELELTEPSFFLHTDPTAATRVADAVADLVAEGS